MPKKGGGGLDSLLILGRGGLARKRDGVFFEGEGVDTPMDTVNKLLKCYS